MGSTRTLRVLPAALVVMFIVTSVSANGQTQTPPLPTKVVEPPAGKGSAYLTATNLASGYVEKEYLVSGLANVYEYDNNGRVAFKSPNQAYTTRILLRYPKDRVRFSGAVIFELLHPELGIQRLWVESRDYLTSRGDAYLHVTTYRDNLRRGKPGQRMPVGSTSITKLKAFDPVRYADINYEEGGLTWDIIGQVGRFIKTDVPSNPLRGLDIKQVIVGGWSGSGALALFYISDGFHARVRMPDGRSIFDGYLVGEPSLYPRINSQSPELSKDDPRQKVQPRDVPAITLHSMSAVTFGTPYRVRPDSDDLNDRYRFYEVAGGAHISRRAGNPKCDFPISEFPLHHYFNLSIDYLKRWSQGKVVPPRTDRISLNPDGSVKLDEHGNPVGGIRSTATDLPVARYFPNSGTPRPCGLGFGAQEQFSLEKLRKLYLSKDEYTAKVTQRANQLVRDGWLLKEDAEEVIRTASRFDGFAGEK